VARVFFGSCETAEKRGLLLFTLHTTQYRGIQYSVVQATRTLHSIYNILTYYAFCRQSISMTQSSKRDNKGLHRAQTEWLQEAELRAGIYGIRVSTCNSSRLRFSNNENLDLQVGSNLRQYLQIVIKTNCEDTPKKKLYAVPV
jgi:hypothetical protein